MIRLHEIALAAAWIFFFASGFSRASCVLLILSGIYAIVMVLLPQSGTARGRRRRNKSISKSINRRM